jgi:hypothetical protein
MPPACADEARHRASKQRVPLSTIFKGTSLAAVLRPLLVGEAAEDKTNAPRKEKKNDFQRRIFGVDCLEINEPGRDEADARKQNKKEQCDFIQHASSPQIEYIFEIGS